MNNVEKFNKDNLYIAGLRYFNKENNGIELGENLSYGIIVKDEVSDTYYNVFNLCEEYPIFRRSCYSNYTEDDEPYGSKIIYHDGLLKDGPCWLIQEKLFSDNLPGVVTLSELEKIVLYSDKYFKDRKEISRKYLRKDPIRLLKVFCKDLQSEEYMDNYFNGREIQKFKRI